ncbi:hypothetical protein [Dyadobacter diqingensis]|nr:hypothetical protein [Dyadobacter diqingensis]
MPDYAVYLSRKAQKQLDDLPDKVVSTLIPAITDLGGNPASQWM